MEETQKVSPPNKHFNFVHTKRNQIFYLAGEKVRHMQAYMVVTPPRQHYEHNPTAVIADLPPTTCLCKGFNLQHHTTIWSGLPLFSRIFSLTFPHYFAIFQTIPHDFPCHLSVVWNSSTISKSAKELSFSSPNDTKIQRVFVSQGSIKNKFGRLNHLQNVKITFLILFSLTFPEFGKNTHFPWLFPDRKRWAQMCFPDPVGTLI